MGGWGTLLDRVSSWLPFKTADQRRRDKIDAIKKELNEITSKADGSYAFRNIAVGLECFVVAFDPNNQYNAVIQDKVIAK